MKLNIKILNTYVLDELGQADIDKVVRYSNQAIDEINNRIMGDYRVEEAVKSGEAESGYDWDGQILALKEGWNKIVEVVVDNTECARRSFSEITNGFWGYAIMDSENLKFSSSSIRNIVLLGYKKIGKIVDLTTEIEIKEKYFSGIIDGMFVHFYKSKDFRDEKMMSYYNMRFENFVDDIDRRKL
jgi:hypothetical protein